MAIHSVKGADLFEEIGEYRGFKLYACFTSYSKDYKGLLKGKARHYLDFGEDALGNIQRLDNLIDKIPEKIKEKERKLEETKELFEKAKEEVVKPFEQADILKAKKERLYELNKLLDIQNVKTNSWDKRKQEISIVD